MANIVDSQYVIQQPNSHTNPTEQYRVVRFGDWHNAMFGDGAPVTPVAVFDKYPDADAKCKELNSQQAS